MLDGAYTMDTIVAANEKTPATVVVAVVNLLPVPPAAISPYRFGVYCCIVGQSVLENLSSPVV